MPNRNFIEMRERGDCPLVPSKRILDLKILGAYRWGRSIPRCSALGPMDHHRKGPIEEKEDLVMQTDAPPDELSPLSNGMSLSGKRGLLTSELS
jgi:hypothetical protein